MASLQNGSALQARQAGSGLPLIEVLTPALHVQEKNVVPASIGRRDRSAQLRWTSQD
jgi:hypothetical protein